MVSSDDFYPGIVFEKQCKIGFLFLNSFSFSIHTHSAGWCILFLSVLLHQEQISTTEKRSFLQPNSCWCFKHGQFHPRIYDTLSWFFWQCIANTQQCTHDSSVIKRVSSFASSCCKLGRHHFLRRSLLPINVSLQNWAWCWKIIVQIWLKNKPIILSWKHLT